MSEVFTLWYSIMQDEWHLYGVFLTANVANNRLDSCQKQYPDRKWTVHRREIGQLGEEQFK